MKAFYKIIVYDYLQRTRSYAFLITLAVALYAAYAFIPAPGAHYTTLRIGNYLGAQNAAWIGCVTAMMTSVFLSLIGPFLVNSAIKKDADTGVGMITAATSVSNFNYLLTKTLSSFLVLLSITGFVFLMSLALFFFRSGGYAFEPAQFILPYLIVTLPTLFFIAALSVTAEVFLYRYTILMNIGFFFLFCALSSQQTIIPAALDIFGVKPVTTAMQQAVAGSYHVVNRDVSMGFIFSSKKDFNSFVFQGVHWTIPVILGRLLWMCFGLLLVFISSKFFHRFDIQQRFKAKKKTKLTTVMSQTVQLRDIRLSELPPVTPSYGILPFIRTELLMLFRKGPRWLWLINIGGMIALAFSPLTVAHQIVLPVLWFLQVGRWSDLGTKEKTHRIHYFTFASYKPLTRLLPAQIIAGITIAIVLASPLLIRYLLSMQFAVVLNIIMGGIFIVLLAVALGILSGGKKLFEILFFLFTYSNINRVPFTDYFGGENHGLNYSALIDMLIGFLGVMSFVLRKFEIRRL